MVGAKYSSFDALKSLYDTSFHQDPWEDPESRDPNSELQDSCCILQNLKVDLLS